MKKSELLFIFYFLTSIQNSFAQNCLPAFDNTDEVVARIYSKVSLEAKTKDQAVLAVLAAKQLYQIVEASENITNKSSQFFRFYGDKDAAKVLSGISQTFSDSKSVKEVVDKYNETAKVLNLICNVSNGNNDTELYINIFNTLLDYSKILTKGTPAYIVFGVYAEALPVILKSLNSISKIVNVKNDFGRKNDGAVLCNTTFILKFTKYDCCLNCDCTVANDLLKNLKSSIIWQNGGKNYSIDLSSEPLPDTHWLTGTSLGLIRLYVSNKSQEFCQTSNSYIPPDKNFYLKLDLNPMYAQIVGIKNNVTQVILGPLISGQRIVMPISNEGNFMQTNMIGNYPNQTNAATFQIKGTMLKSYDYANSKEDIRLRINMK